MRDINNVTLVGRLVADPQAHGKIEGMAEFTIACNDFKDKQGNDRVSFFDCQSWGKTTEAVLRFCHKGMKVAVEGRLVQNRWEHEGKKYSKVTVNVNQIQFLDGKNKPDDTDEAF